MHIKICQDKINPHTQTAHRHIVNPYAHLQETTPNVKRPDLTEINPPKFTTTIVFVRRLALQIYHHRLRMMLYQTTTQRPNPTALGPPDSDTPPSPWSCAQL